MAANPDEIRNLIDEWKAHTDPLALAESVDEPRKVGSVYKMRCPFHEDRNPSMAVYPDGFHCYGCGWHGDAVDFIMALNGWDFRDFIDFIGQFPIDRRIPRHVSKPRPERERPAIDAEQVERWAERIPERFGYWQAQRITPASLLSFGVGWNGQRYTIPWTYRGVVTAVKMRRDDELTPNLDPKYISLKGSRFIAPYNIDAVILSPIVPDPLLIVEDEKSVWVAHQYNLTAISTPANSFKAEWLPMLAHIDNIVIVADADEPGMASAQAIRGMLRRARIEVANALFPDGRPATDLHDLHRAGYDIRKVLDL